MLHLATALAAADIGWRVFPVHSFADGACSCGRADCDSPGKHPRTPRGLTDATIDGEQLREWWGQWPDAGVGLATGEASGVWVLDVDPDKGGEVSMSQLEDEVGELRPALASRTGGGGRHLFWCHPEGLDLGNRAGVLPGLDVRGDGGYVILPPSTHRSGARYEWQGEVDLRRVYPTHAPEALVERVTRRERQARAGAAPHVEGEAIPDGERDDRLTSIAGAMRRQGLAEEEILPSLLVVNDARCDPPLSERQVEKIARSVARYEPEAASAHLTAGSLPDELLPMPPLRGEPMPVELLQVDGLLAELCEWIDRVTPVRQPAATLGASLAALGALYGRRVRTLTNLRTNVYVLLLAESGLGKDGARGCLQAAFEEAGLGEWVGGGNWASGAGLLAALERFPAQVFMVDEIGDVIAAAASAMAKGYKQEILRALKDLYSAAGRTLNPTEYKGKDNQGEPILWPHACVLGTSTPGAFYGGLTQAQLEDGLGNRLLTFPLDTAAPLNLAVDPGVPDAIRAALANHEKITRGAGNLAEADPSQAGCQLVRAVPEAAAMLEAYRMEVRRRRLENDFHRGAIPALWQRVAENGEKLALIRSVSRAPGHPEIRESDVAWGLKVAAWSVRGLEGQLAYWLPESPLEAAIQSVKRVLVREPGLGWTRRDLSRSAHVYGSLLDQVLAELVGSEVVVVDGRYRPVTES